MSNYLSENRPVENVTFTSLYQIEAERARTGRVFKSLDTIEIKEQNEKGKKYHTAKTINLSRVELPAKKSKLPPNALTVLAEAFVAAFSAMDDGVMEQTKDYASLQQLSLTQSKCILESTKETINKEQAEFKKANAIAKEEKKEAKVNKDISIAMIVLGAVLLVASIAMAVFTGGLSLEGAVGGVELIESEVGGEEMVDLGEDTENAIQLKSLPKQVSSEDEDPMEGVQGTKAPQQTAEEIYQNQEEDQTATRTLSKSDSANSKSAESFKSRAAKWFKNPGFSKVRGAVMGAIFGSPMLMEGIEQILVSIKLNHLATAQKNVGIALDTLQRNNMYFQFLRQLVQRKGSVLDNEVKDASEVIQTYASVTNAYKQISYGLANAV